MPEWDGVQVTPEEIEYEQNYREALRNFWLAAKRDELQEVLNSRDFDEWSMPGTSLLKRASGQSTR